jgi:hypothetical protein
VPVLCQEVARRLVVFEVLGEEELCRLRCHGSSYLGSRRSFVDVTASRLVTPRSLAAATARRAREDPGRCPGVRASESREPSAATSHKRRGATTSPVSRAVRHVKSSCATGAGWTSRNETGAPRMRIARSRPRHGAPGVSPSAPRDPQRPALMRIAAVAPPRGTAPLADSPQDCGFPTAARPAKRPRAASP